jgi:hypothetical protein
MFSKKDSSKEQNVFKPLPQPNIP